MNWIKIVLLSFFFGIFGGIFSSQILWPYIVEKLFPPKYYPQPSQVYVVERTIKIPKDITLKEAIEKLFQEPIEKVEKSSFFVETQHGGKKISGSGFILTSDGLAVTLTDFLPSGGKPRFFVEKNPVQFQILKKDLKNNLALIKFEGRNFSSSAFSSLEKLKLGEKIFLVANFKRENEIEILVDEGNVKNFNKDLIETNFKEDERILGAPVFNFDAEFLGLIFFKDKKVFVIPIEKIKEFTNL